MATPHLQLRKRFSEFLGRVAAVELRCVVTKRGGNTGGDLWQHGCEGAPGARCGGGHGGANNGAAMAPEGHAKVPLRLEVPLGALLHKDRSPFDDKLTTNQEYQFDGLQGGFSWQEKLTGTSSRERPFPELLEFAE